MSQIKILNLTKKTDPAALPPDTQCHTLVWHDSPLESPPPGLVVTHKLDLSDSKRLRELPAGLRVAVLSLRNCTALQSLPENLDVDFLDLTGCTALTRWPESVTVRIGGVVLRGCTALPALPANLGPLTSLDLRDCALIQSIPSGVRVSSWIDIGGTRITSLPEHLSKVRLRWRGVRINHQIAFFPETLDCAQVLGEPNAEVRRVMIERMGFERFMAGGHAAVLHTDRDPGGERKLLKISLVDDEDIVCVSVNCPSTGRHYLIRVPPDMKTCHQAVAWTAGFDNPDDYQPVAET